MEPNPQREDTGSVLIVDDERSIRRVTSLVLRRSGFRVLVAEHGGEAVSLFREHCVDISGVLLDLELPGISGLEVLREIRSIRSDVPVLFMSGGGEPPVAEALNGGGVLYLQKPFTGEKLVEGVVELLALERGTSGLDSSGRAPQ